MSTRAKLIVGLAVLLLGVRLFTGFLGGPEPDLVSVPAKEPTAASPEQMRQKIDAQISTLPPEKQAAARLKAEEKIRMVKESEGLTEAEKKAKLTEHFQVPRVQAEMDDAWAARESREIPEIRRDRYEAYIKDRAAAKVAP